MNWRTASDISRNLRRNRSETYGTDISNNFDYRLKRDESKSEN